MDALHLLRYKYMYSEGILVIIIFKFSKLILIWCEIVDVHVKPYAKGVKKVHKTENWYKVL